MATSPSVEFFLRYVGERHSDLRQRINDVLVTLVTENSDAKENQIKIAREAAEALASAVSAGDRPGWLNQLMSNLSRQRSIYPLRQLLVELIPLLEPMNNHQWHAEVGNDLAVDFDSVFEHYRKQSRIPDLFDQVVDVLEKISTSEDIDSRKVLLALERLIATLRKNKTGSYFSMKGAWEFLVGLLRNFLLEELKKIPTLGSLIVALEKSIGDLNGEMVLVHQQMAEEMKRTLNSDFPFLTYDQKGVPMLSAPDSKAGVVDAEV